MLVRLIRNGTAAADGVFRSLLNREWRTPPTGADHRQLHGRQDKHRRAIIAADLVPIFEQSPILTDLIDYPHLYTQPAWGRRTPYSDIETQFDVMTMNAASGNWLHG